MREIQPEPNITAGLASGAGVEWSRALHGQLPLLDGTYSHPSDHRFDRPIEPSIGFVSTYPPTACGIATFTKALRGALSAGRHSADELKVVGLVDRRSQNQPPEVIFQHLNGNRNSLKSAAKALNQMDVAVVQHEFGIYGGTDGAEVLDLLAALQIPSIVVLHTVPRSPTPNQRMILESLVRESSETILLSESALNQLVYGYNVERNKLGVVPHGAIANRTTHREPNERPILLTWGLIGPGKGLETAIEAVAGLRDIHPLPRYLILGETHPKVRAASGNAYVDGLIERSRELDVDGIVEFDNRYAGLAELTATVRQADVVVLPYESTEQVTSGVLVEAIAAGKPVIATEFPHAVEMLGTGAGIVVPHADPMAMTRALRLLLSDPARRVAMERVARSMGSSLDWTNVASRYEQIVSGLVPAPSELVDLTGPLSRRVPADLSRTG